MPQSVLIVIPAYNEKLTIGSVVVLSKKYGDVLVVDDGSRDRTGHIAEAAGAKVIRHPENRGKAQALKTGFLHALENSYDIVVTLDADGQHNPGEIPRVMEPVLSGEADLVIGSRFLNGGGNGIPLYRRFGLWVLNTTTNVGLNGTLKITDSQSGFRAMNRKALEKIVGMNSNGYTMESDMLLRLAEEGVRIKEVPINARYDVPNKHKKNPVRHGVEVLADLVGLIGYKRPLLLFTTLSVISFIISAGLFVWAFSPYEETGRIYLTQAVGAGVFTIIGVQMFIAGLTLNVLAKMVRE